jgi:hypothetical protein
VKLSTISNCFSKRLTPLYPNSKLDEIRRKVRQNIDRLLEQARWIIQDLKDLNQSAGTGVAVREFPAKTGALTTCTVLFERQWGQWNRKNSMVSIK